MKPHKIMNELFRQVNLSYKLRKDAKFRSYNVKTVYYGTKTLSYLAPKIWNLIPSEVKNSETLEIFRKKNLKRKPHICPCRLCKTFIVKLSFVNID